MYVSFVFPHCIRSCVHIYPHFYLYIFGPSASIMNTSAIHNSSNEKGIAITNPNNDWKPFLL
jgi:hypothetical protein